MKILICVVGMALVVTGCVNEKPIDVGFNYFEKFDIKLKASVERYTQYFIKFKDGPVKNEFYYRNDTMLRDSIVEAYTMLYPKNNHIIGITSSIKSKDSIQLMNILKNE